MQQNGCFPLLVRVSGLFAILPVIVPSLSPFSLLSLSADLGRADRSRQIRTGRPGRPDQADQTGQTWADLGRPGQNKQNKQNKQGGALFAF